MFKRGNMDAAYPNQSQIYDEGANKTRSHAEPIVIGPFCPICAAVHHLWKTSKTSASAAEEILYVWIPKQTHAE